MLDNVQMEIKIRYGLVLEWGIIASVYGQLSKFSKSHSERNHIYRSYPKHEEMLQMADCFIYCFGCSLSGDI